MCGWERGERVARFGAREVGRLDTAEEGVEGDGVGRPGVDAEDVVNADGGAFVVACSSSGPAIAEEDGCTGWLC